MGPWVVCAHWGTWLGRAGLWGAGDWLCCDVTGAGADMTSWDVGRVERGHGGAVTVRASGALCPDPAHLALLYCHVA